MMLSLIIIIVCMIGTQYHSLNEGWGFSRYREMWKQSSIEPQNKGLPLCFATTSEEFRYFWIFCVMCGMLKLLLILISSDSNYKFCHLLVYKEGSCIDHASCEEYLLMFLVKSQYGVQNLNHLRTRCKIQYTKQVSVHPVAGIANP